MQKAMKLDVVSFLFVADYVMPLRYHTKVSEKDPINLDALQTSLNRWELK